MTSKSITIRNYRTEIPGKIVNGTWEFPTIYGTNKLGKRIEWTIIIKAIKVPSTMVNKEGKIAISELTDAMFIDVDKFLDNSPVDNTGNEKIYGYINVISKIEGGKIRATVPDIVYVGKNVKSKSATNPICQAMRDALSKYNKQNTKKAEVTNEKLFPPMLAQVFADQKKPITYPVSVQRKYNGIRAICYIPSNTGEKEENNQKEKEKKVEIYSRQLKPYYGFNKIREECQLLISQIDGANLYLDGELYKHGEALQDISGVARRENNTDDALKIEEDTSYMIYDCFTESNTLTYTERRELLKVLFTSLEEKSIKLTRITLVETFEAESSEKVKELYNSFIKEGYEGAMIRINDQKYDFSYNDRHSKFLLKMKETHDGEYKIIGWETGSRGKAANALMIVCETKGGKKFNCTPALPIEEREALAAKMPTFDSSDQISSDQKNQKNYFEQHYLNKMLIVYYDEKSKDDVPQRARTKMEIRSWD